jgi:hypothetical protein
MMKNRWVLFLALLVGAVTAVACSSAVDEALLEPGKPQFVLFYTEF